MRRSRFLFYVAVALGLLIPLSAEAAPYGATYAPSALTCLTPNQVKTHPITVTNTGTNTWTIQRPGGYHLSYHWFQGPNQVVWEGERTYLPNQVNPNQSIALQANLKAPAALGTYTLRWDMVHENVAWFSNQGVPTGNQTVEVKASCPGSLVGLCAIIGCGGVLVGPPKIDAIVPLVSNITPGGAAVVKGSWFGNDQGELWLKGLKKWNGEAYGDVKLSFKKEPGKDFWKPTSVLGFIPGNITQVKDQPAKLQIKTAANHWSNEFPVNFRAAKDYVTLLRTDAAVQVISCGTNTSGDYCNSWKDPDDEPIYGSCFEVDETFCGGHWNALWATFGTDTGTDKFQITLKNGWVLEFMDFTKWISVVGEGSVTAPSGFTPGSTSWQPHVPWSATANDYVGYQGFVTIAGPKGVPWK